MENLTTMMDLTRTTTIAQRDQTGHYQNRFLTTLGNVQIRSSLGRSLVMQLSLVKVVESMVATPWDAISTEKLQTTASQAQCAFQTQTSIAGPGLTAVRAIDIDFPQARSTQWTPGSVVPVGFVAIYHGSG